MTTSHNSKTPRVMVLGIDGATLDLIRPWAAAGRLPTFQRLLTQGAWGTLRSTMLPVTPAAWSSLATGVNPGKHGVFDFFVRQDNGYETLLANATHRHAPSLWRLLSDAGRRVIVHNVPATYPPEAVNGLMVSGAPTPPQAADAAWPPTLLEDLKQAVPHFGLHPPGVFSHGQEVDFIQDVLAWDKMTFEVTEHLMRQQPWDFLFTVFIGVDIISHFMWRHMVTQGASAANPDPAFRQAVTEAIQRVYQQVDTFVAKFLEIADDQTYVVLVSDHGFGPLDYYLHANAWLAQRGYLKFKRNLPVQLKYLAYRLGFTRQNMLELLRRLGLARPAQQSANKQNTWLNRLTKRVFLSTADVDWSQTTAYSTGFGGPLFINCAGREPQGIVKPGAEYEALLSKLTADLRALRDPHTGEPMIGEIYRPTDLYTGPYTPQAADLIYVPRDWRNQGFGIHGFASNRWLEPSPDRTGTHRLDGILFLHGPGLRPGGEVTGAALWDVAPTILALMGLPIPKNMDGQVLTAALDDTARAQLTVTYSDPVEGGPAPGVAAAMSPEEEQVILDRLEALGYGG
jgi:predicted AlkP superfamily phosphohydrolase/phosphomutase